MNEQMTNALETLRQMVIADYLNFQGLENRTEVQARMADEFINGLEVRPGNKYIKILTNRSVWGFIVNTDDDAKFKRGDILKAAGFNAPARNKARGNLFDDVYEVRWTGPLYL